MDETVLCRFKAWKSGLCDCTAIMRSTAARRDEDIEEKNNGRKEGVIERKLRRTSTLFQLMDRARKLEKL